MAARRKSTRRVVRMARNAVEMECRVCKADLTAKPTKVPNPFDTDRAPATALRAPQRCVITFTFAGYTPPRANLTIPLCDACADRVTFTRTGVPLMIDPEGQATEAQGKLSALVEELSGVLGKFRK